MARWWCGGPLGLYLWGVSALGLGGCDQEYVVGASGLTAIPGAAVVSAPTAVALGDLDGDGALDAAYLDAASQVCTLRGHSDGSLVPAVCVPLGEPAAALGIAALGPTAQATLLVAGRSLTAYTAQPDLTPTLPVRYPLTGAATALRLAYVRCDGAAELGGCRRDVLVSDGSASEVAVFFASASADGSLRGPQRFPVGIKPVALLFADLDGDGSAELITASPGSVPLTILGARGVAGFTGCSDGRVQPVLGRPSALAALDLDHDGRRVLVVADAADASLRLFRVARAGVFTLDCGEAAESRLPVAADPLALATADFDGDQVEDLLIAHGSPSGLSLLLTGPGGLRAPRVYAVGSAIRGIAVDDLDHDGRPDVVIASSGDKTIRILRSTFR